MRSKVPFLGKKFLGDFIHILHIFEVDRRSQEVNAVFKRSALFLVFKKLKLRRNMCLWTFHQDGKSNKDTPKLPCNIIIVCKCKLQAASCKKGND